MLLFSSGTFTVDGITVFPDHADKNQFWYLPGPVGLEMESADSKEPQFLLIMYAPDVAAAGIHGTGFLNVTLCLTVSNDTQSKLLGQIQSQFPDADNPLLSPVPFDEGTVQIVALDMQGNSTTPGASGQAVQNILGTSNPELFGNNDAVFALTLSEEGATILQLAFQDGMTPVGGIYTLKFTGVLPALDVKITADMKRMYTSFSVAFGASAYFASIGIDATFEKLRQDGVIQVEVVNLSTTGDTTAAENWALGLFKDQIMSQWFTPSLSPTTETAADASSVSTGKPTGPTSTPSGGGTTTPPKTPSNPMGGGSTGGSQTGGSMGASHGGATGMGGSTNPTATGTTAGAATTTPPATGVTQTTTPPATGATTTPPATTSPTTPTTPTTTTPTTPPATGAAGAAGAVAKAAASAPGTAAAASSAASPFGISLKLKYVSQDELKTVEIDFNQMNAVQRVYSPQGYFGLLLQGIDQSKHFLKVDGTDPFFNQFSVTVNPPRDLTGIGLDEAHVALDYGTDTANPKHGEYIFDSTHLTPQVWDVYEGLIQETAYTYTPDYQFDPDSGWFGEQLAYTQPATQTENRMLTLDPHEFLGFLQVTISAERINSTLVDRIEVPLQYTSKTGWQQSSTIVVRPGNAAQTWKVRRSDRDDTSDLYSYTTNCYLKDGTLISSPAVTSSATAILVSDPFIGAINLMVQPAFDGTAFTMAIVEITYADAPVSYNFSTIVQLQATSPATRITIPLIHRETIQYQYRVTMITTANQSVQGTYRAAQDPLLVVTGTP